MFYTSLVEIQKNHLNITKVQKDGKDITRQYQYRECVGEVNGSEYKLKLKDIYNFAYETEIGDLENLMKLQITHNGRIAEEGMKNDYGAKVGKNYLKLHEKEKTAVLAAYAAAGSDARMGGSILPVVANSGSGNQGITNAYDHITLMCRLKATQARNKELESGERYIQLKELHQKEYRLYEHKIRKLESAIADAHKEAIRVRNYWFQVLEDMLLEFESMQKKAAQELQEMEKRVLLAEKQRDDALDKVKELRL